MNGRLSFITLAVADLERAAGFYVQVFEWPEARRVEPARFFELPQLTVALMSGMAMAEFCNVHDLAAPSPGALLSWNLDQPAEVDALLARGRELGATITRQAGELPWGGYAGVILTPDGHCWEIVCRTKPDSTGSPN